MNLPRTTVDEPYTDTCTHLKTVGDLRKLINGADDALPIYWFDGMTVFDIEAEIKIQECIEHNGKQHDATGLIFQIEG